MKKTPQPPTSIAEKEKKHNFRFCYFTGKTWEDKMRKSAWAITHQPTAKAQ